MSISIVIDFMGLSDALTLGLYSAGLVGWGVYLAREVYRRRREGLGRKFAFACYHMAAFSAFVGISLVL